MDRLILLGIIVTIPETAFRGPVEAPPEECYSASYNCLFTLVCFPVEKEHILKRPLFILELREEFIALKGLRRQKSLTNC